jgi:hypothetical protein
MLTVNSKFLWLIVNSLYSAKASKEGVQRALQLGEAAAGRAGHGPGAPVAQARRTAGEGTPGKSSQGAQRWA